MSDDDLCDRLGDLETGDGRRVVALPDGSVDRWYALTGGGGDRLETVDAFADQLADGARSFSREPIAVRPGGQAVNAARQCHALGETVTLVGHLDHPVLSEFPFETRSMGTPAAVDVVAFDDGELQLSGSGPADDWGLEDLLAVVDWDRILDADALCCTNWVSVRGLTAVFDRLASAATTPLPVVVDPGPIEAVDPAALEDLFAALSSADSDGGGIEVILSVNPTELDAAVAVRGADGSASGGDSSDARSRTRVRDRVATLRDAIDVTGVVSHGADAAVGSVGDGTVVVEMVELGDPERTTGAGDRFSAGLACGLARDWPFETALALGNACAAHFVATGDTADPAALRAALEP